LKEFLKDQIEQSWTVVGLIIAWLVLEGTAKDVVGWLILAAITVWTITYPLRKD
jgi:hypothetical protein